MVRKGRSIAWLVDEPESASELRYDHAMDVSGRVYARMREFGLDRAALAGRMGTDEAQVSRILTGMDGLSPNTVARLEDALGFRLGDGLGQPEPPSPARF